jgi:hypothetical protein
MSGPPPSTEAKKALGHEEDEAIAWVKFWTDHRQPPTSQQLKNLQPTDYLGIARAGIDLYKGLKNPTAAVKDAIEEKGKQPTIDRFQKEILADDKGRKRPKYPCLHFKALIEEYEDERHPHLKSIGLLTSTSQQHPSEPRVDINNRHLDPEKSRSYSIGESWQAIFDPRKALTFFIDAQGGVQTQPPFSSICLGWPTADEREVRTYLIEDSGGWKLRFDPVLGRSWFVDVKGKGHLSDPMSYTVPEFALGKHRQQEYEFQRSTQPVTESVGVGNEFQKHSFHPVPPNGVVSSHGFNHQQSTATATTATTPSNITHPIAAGWKVIFNPDTKQTWYVDPSGTSHWTPSADVPWISPDGTHHIPSEEHTADENNSAWPVGRLYDMGAGWMVAQGNKQGESMYRNTGGKWFYDPPRHDLAQHR